jgi:hypothetical protein
LKSDPSDSANFVNLRHCQWHIEPLLCRLKDFRRVATRRFVCNIQRFLEPSEIHVIAGGDIGMFSSILSGLRNIYIHSEREFAPHLDLKEISGWPVSGFPQRAGWYYQQFLKMAVSESSTASERFVIWDADTIPYRHMTFFDGDAHCFTVHKKEFHHPYFHTNARLIGIDRRRDGPAFSAISQHMPVSRFLMKALLSALESQSGTTWADAIRSAISDGEGHSLFSEYELYFDYVTSITTAPYVLVERPWYRFGNSCWPDQRLFLRYRSSFTSFEAWDKRKPFSVRNWLERWSELFAPARRAGAVTLSRAARRKR